MKKYISLLALSVAFIISGCKKKESEVTAATDTPSETVEKFVVDSVKTVDSMKISKMLSANYESKVLVFPTIKDKNLLDSIYYNKPVLSDFSKQGLQNFLNKDKNEYFTSVKDKSLDFSNDLVRPQSWESGSSMRLISNKNDFLQIEYLFSSYEGGAHSNYAFSERVFDLKNNKKVELTDITNISQAKLEQLLMQNINKIPSGTTGGGRYVNNSEMLLVDKIPVNTNFYFDEKNLYFHYSPYEIAAFAAGDIVIPVSWRELEGTLNPDFKKRLKIN